MTIRLVHLEDDPLDRELVAETLRGQDIDFTLESVDSRADFERALAQQPDLILSDYSLPGFGGDEAQELAARLCPDVPFVFVSGSIGEERAVERVKMGATDYVLKDRLEKLAPAVKRALREREERHRRARAEADLRKLNAELEARVEERTRALLSANAALQEARLEAERANAAKSEFLSRMSHDLRTPLNAIMGFAQLLRLEMLTDTQADSLGHILRGGEHLLNMINEVLDIARIEAGQLTLSREPVSVADVTNQTAALIRPIAAKRRIEMSADIDPSLYVFADRQRLTQIVLNLLSNAVKYNRESGTIRMRARQEGDRVAIEVADTGAGIPPDKLALLFTPFERLGAEQSAIEGTGLGLALSKRLAEQMDGTLTVKSVTDQGAVFCVTLPQCSAVEITPPAPPASIAQRTDYTGTVLYIEDNIPNVVLMERLLRLRPRVTLQHAATGAAGLDAVAAHQPDLVILDLHLSDMPGEDVLRQLWENPATRGLPVVVLSADATPHSQRELLASGAMAYLTKPFNIAAVLGLIDQFVGQLA